MQDPPHTLHVEECDDRRALQGHEQAASSEEQVRRLRKALFKGKFSPSPALTFSGPQREDIKARGEWKSLSAPLEHINLHVRGGYILPWQEPALNTELR